MNTQILQQQFSFYTSKFCGDNKLSETVFSELLSRYNEPHRHYHNLNHITTLLTDAEAFFQGEIPEALFFAIWFHDVIYNATSRHNEERSAELANSTLLKMSFPETITNECATLIHKTADHFNAEAGDVIAQFFLDADLKILGSDEHVYREYLVAVRKEYSSLPTLLFNIGRRKFLRKALDSKRIFRTEEHFNKYEQQARRNLQNELNQLS